MMWELLFFGAALAYFIVALAAWVRSRPKGERAMPSDPEWLQKWR